MQKHDNAQQEGNKITKSSGSHGETIPPTVNSTVAVRENAQFPPGNIVSTDLSYSISLLHGQRSSLSGLLAAASSAMHGGGQTIRNRKQMETEIRNR